MSIALVFFLMIRRPPRSTRTDTLCPYTTLFRSQSIIEQTSVVDFKGGVQQPYIENAEANLLADPVVQYMNKAQLEKSADQTRRQMQDAAKEMDFLRAAKLRDELFAMEELIREKRSEERRVGKEW